MSRPVCLVGVNIDSDAVQWVRMCDDSALPDSLESVMSRSRLCPLSFGHRRPRRAPLAPLLLALLLAACAGPGPKPGEGGALSESRPVASLLARADARSEAGELELAAALLERALRIEPRNPWLWYRLAELRLQQGRYTQAISLARKADSLAPGNADLHGRSLHLIEQARGAGGGTL